MSNKRKKYSAQEKVRLLRLHRRPKRKIPQMGWPKHETHKLRVRKQSDKAKLQKRLETDLIKSIPPSLR